MAALILALTTLLGQGELVTISGTVVDANNVPISQADVFMENGITGPITATKTNPDGKYTFHDIIPGFVSVFAIKRGHAFNGFTDYTSKLEIKINSPIVLSTSTPLKVTINNHQKKGIANARVTRVLIDKQVGVPLGKLQEFGWNPPASDRKGVWNAELFSAGQSLDLKIAHAEYAQEVLTAVSPGSATRRVSMNPGVLLSGPIFLRNTRTPVPNAWLKMVNLHPPHESYLTRSGGDGLFGLRVKPGQYSYEVLGSSYRSPQRSEITVTGEFREQSITAFVAGQTPVSGMVIDAKTTLPIQGAKLRLYVSGKDKETAYSRPSGEFFFMAPEGENSVAILSAPGYLLPKKPNIEFRAHSDKKTVLPEIWLAPVPRYSLLALGIDGEPLPNTSLTLLDPMQIGWHRTDEKGEVEFSIARLPETGNVIGLAVHPIKEKASLFSIPKKQSKKSVISLFPAVTVSGTVAKGNGDQVMMGMYYGNNQLPQPLLIKSTMTQFDGTFEFHNVPIGIPFFYGLLGSAPSQWRALKGEDGGPNVIAEFTLPNNWSSPLPEWDFQKFVKSNSFLKKKGNPSFVYVGSHPEPAVILELLGTIEQQLSVHDINVIWVTPASISSQSEVRVIQSEVPEHYSRYFFVDENNNLRHESIHVPSSNSLIRFSKH